MFNQNVRKRKAHEINKKKKKKLFKHLKYCNCVQPLLEIFIVINK